MKVQNMSNLQASIDVPERMAAYEGLLVVVAAMLDKIAEGHNVYMTIGSTMKGDSYSWTVREAGEKSAVYADSLEELAGKYQTHLTSSMLAPNLPF